MELELQQRPGAVRRDDAPVPRGGVPAHRRSGRSADDPVGFDRDWWRTGRRARLDGACSSRRTSAAAASAARVCSTSCSWPRRWAGWCRPGRSCPVNVVADALAPVRHRRAAGRGAPRRWSPASAVATWCFAEPGGSLGRRRRAARRPRPTAGGSRRTARSRTVEDGGPGRPLARDGPDRRRPHAVPGPGRHAGRHRAPARAASTSCGASARSTSTASRCRRRPSSARSAAPAADVERQLQVGAGRCRAPRPSAPSTASSTFTLEYACDRILRPAASPRTRRSSTASPT